MEVRETQIEDVLVNSPVLTKKILNLEDEPRLIGRQIIVPSGRLDMLYAHKTKLLLLELKVSAFQRKFIQQVLEYKQDLINFQNTGRLLQGEIQPYLLCPMLNDSQRRLGLDEGVICFDYNPEEILNYFYQNLRPIASFVEIKPMDIGIWNLHLIHKFIYKPNETSSVNLIGRPPKQNIMQRECIRIMLLIWDFWQRQKKQFT